MTHPDQLSDRELETIMAEGRQIRRAPDVVRARLLARARVAVAASGNARPRTAAPVVFAAPRGRWIAVAAGLGLALVTAGAAAALHARATRSVRDLDSTVHIRRAEPSVPVSIPQPPEAQPAPHVTPTSSRRERPRRFLSPKESYAAELHLLQRAQSEYTSRDFPDALVLLAEHERRFPDGRLAEEREALRVRSLVGAGRGDEARRALVAFGRHFPHSVLLPRLRQTAQAAAE